MSSAKVAHSVKGWSPSSLVKVGLDCVRVDSTARAASRAAGSLTSRKDSACLATVNREKDQFLQSLIAKVAVKSLTQKVTFAPEGICASSQYGGSEDGCEGGSHFVSKVPCKERAQKSEKGTARN